MTPTLCGRRGNDYGAALKCRGGASCFCGESPYRCVMKHPDCDDTASGQNGWAYSDTRTCVKDKPQLQKSLAPSSGLCTGWDIPDAGVPDKGTPLDKGAAADKGDSQ